MTYVLSRYSKNESPIAPNDTAPELHFNFPGSMDMGYNPLGTVPTSPRTLCTFAIGVSARSDHRGSPTLSDKETNSSESVPNSASGLLPCAHPGCFARPVFKFTIGYGIPDAVANAGFNRVARFVALFIYISSPERSYAARTPPNTRIVVSKTLASRSTSKLSRLETHSRARPYSSDNPMIHSVSSESTMVAPRPPNAFFPSFARGRSSSSPNAYFS
mmetsp:Transcript_326/g.1078  ORF Transcript_326/g.1078 Transcript_326/m.1078 type:complete len:217 (-) Transcript_326:606-1256(-)